MKKARENRKRFGDSQLAVSTQASELARRIAIIVFLTVLVSSAGCGHSRLSDIEMWGTIGEPLAEKIVLCRFSSLVTGQCKA